MGRWVQTVSLAVALCAVFQFDPKVRDWEGERIRGLMGRPDAIQQDQTPLPAPEVPTRPPAKLRAEQLRRELAYEGDTPTEPVTHDDAPFPGPGWYRVKIWRGWQPEGLVHCRQIDYRWIASADEWWDMYWGAWDHDAGSEVGADARMHTTDGVRLDAKPDAATILAAN